MAFDAKIVVYTFIYLIEHLCGVKNFNGSGLLLLLLLLVGLLSNTIVEKKPNDMVKIIIPLFLDASMPNPDHR